MALAPTQLGGSVTYVIVDGNSMEPHFRFGDLVLVRTETAYSVGDAVIYQNAEMGRYVFHRITGTELGHFILKGDNNSWLDSYQPVQDEIIGKLWVHIPKLGKVFEWVRLPINMAIMVALLGGVFMSGAILKPNKSGGETNKPPKNFKGLREGGLYVSIFLSLFFLGLTIFTFTKPLTVSKSGIPYQQEGSFYYTATGTPGVYDTNIIRSGEPIFPKLTCFLNVGFTYNLLAAQAQGVSGIHQIYARVMDDQSGWQRTIPLSSQTAFSGNSYFSMSTVDLCQVESLITLVEQETGLHPNTYSLDIIANVAVAGLIEGSPINDTFTPILAFKFDKMHVYLANNDPKVEALHSLKQGLAGGSELQKNTFSIFGLNPTVGTIRTIALIGFIFSLMGLFFIGLQFYQAAQQSEDALIRLQYGGMLVDVYEQSLAPTSSTIDVTTIDNLAKLAERQGAMILHMTQNFLHYYLVQINGTTYRYVVTAGKKGTLENKAPETAGIHEENKPIQIEAEPVQEKQPQNEISEYVTNENKDDSVNIEIETEAAWRKIQSDAANYLNSHPKNKRIEANPSHQEAAEYMIQTGNIEFDMPESSAETFMLRKIKI